MSVPRHAALTEALRDEIVSGRWAVGLKLPPEVTLARMRGVSRATLRRSLDALESEGLVARRKCAGTVVAAREPQKTFRMVTGSFGDVLSLGRETRFHTTATRHVEDGTEPLLTGRESVTGYWLEIEGTRYLPGDARPFNWSRIFVSGRYSGIEPALDGPTGAVFQVIESLFSLSITRVAQSMGALPCPPEAARAMGLAAGAPVTAIDADLFADSGELVEVSHAIFDPARFRVRTDVRME